MEMSVIGVVIEPANENNTRVSVIMSVYNVGITAREDAIVHRVDL